MNSRRSVQFDKEGMSFGVAHDTRISEHETMVHGMRGHTVEPAVLELLAAVILIASYLWFGRQWFPGALAAFALPLLWLTWWSHRRAGEDAREIGFRLDTAPAAAAWLFPVILVAAAIAIVTASRYGLLRAPSIARAAPSLGMFVASGLLQQYLLLGFFYRRCLEVIRSPVIAGIVTTIVFAALHTPNLFLALLTFAAGLISCAVYRRAPNLYVAGIAHGLLAYVLYQALPPYVTGGMRVGIEYLQHS